MADPRIIIIGAGPAGLGAAWRLNELGHTNWLVLERGDAAGGLSASVVDEHSFTWDLGGHVQFSHYKYFDDVMDQLLGPDGWIYHERESWIWIRDRFVPYPFQQNIRRLPREDVKRCVAGLIELYKNAPKHPTNFAEWISATFGEGIADLFMRPYNFKVWAYPLEKLSYSWISERVAVTDLERVINNIIDERDDISWGPNNTFRFPKHGGTGAIWRECARRLPDNQIRYRAEVVSIDPTKRRVQLADGSTEEYDLLFSAMPLDRFVASTHHEEMKPSTDKLLHSSTHVFGVGLRGAPREELATKCWMYFPESNSPFYRVTLFSNYSPNNVPDIRQYWSLMAEVSESPSKPVPEPDAQLEDVIQGMLNTRLIGNRSDICCTWQTRLEYSYPTPSLERDAVIMNVLPTLEKQHLYSRGRFGAWRYEVSNQDHSFMQGVEWANRVVSGGEELTLWHPEIVNDPSRC